jgi:hypothetical protein
MFQWTTGRLPMLPRPEEKMFLTETGRLMLRGYCSDMLGAPVGSDPSGEVSGGKPLSEEIINMIYIYLGVSDVFWGVKSDLITGKSDRVRAAQSKYYQTSLAELATHRDL